MAKRARAKAVEVDSRDAQAARIAATLPDDRAGLLAVGADAVAALHAAVMAFDDAGADAAQDRYEAAVWKLTGGTFSSSANPSNPDAGALLLEEHCRADNGAVPMWGQYGEFMITVSGISAVVEVSHGFGRFMVSLAFHVVSPNIPFISETGYRSHFLKYQGGKTIAQAAEEVFAGFLATNRKHLAPPYRQRYLETPARTWFAMPATPPAAALAYVDVGGQLAFGF